MTWRRFHLLLCLVMVVVTLLRLASGNLIGAAVSALLAVVFGSIGLDYPLLAKLRGLIRIVRGGKRWWGGGGGSGGGNGQG